MREREVGTHRYEFRREHMGAILGVEEMVMEKRVEDHLRREDQETIGAFTDDDEDRDEDEPNKG